MYAYLENTTHNCGWKNLFHRASFVEHMDYGEDKQNKLSIRQHFNILFYRFYFYMIARGSITHTGYQEYSKQANQQLCSLRSSLDGSQLPQQLFSDGEHHVRHLPVTQVCCCQSQSHSAYIVPGQQPET